MSSKRILLFLFFFLFFFLSCKDNRWEYNEINIVNKNKPIFIDFDYALFNFSNTNLKKIISINYNENEILGYLFFQCLGLGNPNDSMFYKSVNLFRNDAYIKSLENEIDISLRGKISVFEKNLNFKFQKLGYFIKNKPLPKRIFWLNTLFSSSVFCSQNEIGVGLERYVGSNKAVIKKLPTDQFFQWMKDGMRKEFLERDVLVNWIYTHYVDDNEGSLVEKMIQWGKVYYILNVIDQDLPEYLVLRYQKQKYDWCLKNEDKIWKYIVSQSLVFSKNERDISNFINDGPFTPGLPEKGPDRLGQFIGYKMVMNHMEIHNNKSLDDLLLTSYNTILQEYQID